MSTGKLLFKDTLQRPEADGARRFRFVVSTGRKDRDGDIIEPSGWQLDHYRRNPVVLWTHGGPPVGKCRSIGVVRDRLLATVEFMPKGANATADTVCGMIGAGFLRACSAGFRPLKTEPLDTGGLRVLSQELMEISIVSLPSNVDAVLLDDPVKKRLPHSIAKMAMHDLSPTEEFARALSVELRSKLGLGMTREDLLYLVRAEVERQLR